MKGSLACRLEAFVRGEGAPLIDAIGDALDAPFAVIGPDGTLLAGRAPSDGPSALDVPIAHHEGDLGMVRVSAPAHRPLADAMARDLARRIDADDALDELTLRLGQCYDELNLLYRLARSRRPGQDLRRAARALLGETAELLDGRRVLLHLADRDRPVTHVALGADAVPSTDLDDLAHTPARLAALLTSIRDQAEDPSTVTDRVQGTVAPGLHHALVPVRRREKVAGFVGIIHRADEEPVPSGEFRLLECLAAQLSSVATTRDLRQELEDVLFNTVRSLVAAIDAKDPYTRGHSQRVYQTSVAIARHLGLSRPLLQTLTWSALLHDVGKIAIPFRILAKPTSLTPEEYEIVKTHPVRGCVVIEPIPQLRSVLPGIRHHHERWDGLGYPDGLAGHDIPLIARIIAVADTYDAMVTTRAYRTARTHEAAVEEIRISAGTQLDPDIVDAFLELVSEGVVTAPDVGPLKGAA